MLGLVGNYEEVKKKKGKFRTKHKVQPEAATKEIAPEKRNMKKAPTFDKINKSRETGESRSEQCILST